MKRFACLVMLVGCGGDGGSGLPSDDLDEGVRTSCERAHACKSTYPGMPSDFTLVYGASIDACVMQNSPPMAYAEALDASVKAGRISYSSSDASACTAFFAGLTCDTSTMGYWGPYDLPASCMKALTGKVKAGDSCTLWQDADGDDHDVGDCAEPNECSADTSTCGPG